MNRMFITYILCLFSVLSIAQDITFVSWNLRDFGQSRDDSEINLIAKELRHADIVAIQEVVAKHPGGAQAVARLLDKFNCNRTVCDFVKGNPIGVESPFKNGHYALGYLFDN